MTLPIEAIEQLASTFTGRQLIWTIMDRRRTSVEMMYQSDTIAIDIRNKSWLGDQGADLQVGEGPDFGLNILELMQKLRSGDLAWAFLEASSTTSWSMLRATLSGLLFETGSRFRLNQRW